MKKFIGIIGGNNVVDIIRCPAFTSGNQLSSFPTGSTLMDAVDHTVDQMDMRHISIIVEFNGIGLICM